MPKFNEEGEFGWMEMGVMGGKSCVGSMGSSFDVLTAGVGQNAGVESTLMVVSPLKSRMGETGVKDGIDNMKCEGEGVKRNNKEKEINLYYYDCKKDEIDL